MKDKMIIIPVIFLAVFLFGCAKEDKTACTMDAKQCPETSNPKLKVTDCPAQRPEACTMDYNPACGWFDPAKIQCIKYPCTKTFSNSCGACSDENVISWSAGECPK